MIENEALWIEILTKDNDFAIAMAERVGVSEERALTLIANAWLRTWSHNSQKQIDLLVAAERKREKLIDMATREMEDGDGWKP